MDNVSALMFLIIKLTFHHNHDEKHIQLVCCHITFYRCMMYKKYCRHYILIISIAEEALPRPQPAQPPLLLRLVRSHSILTATWPRPRPRKCITSTTTTTRRRSSMPRNIKACPLPSIGAITLQTIMPMRLGQSTPVNRYDWGYQGKKMFKTY